MQSSVSSVIVPLFTLLAIASPLCSRAAQSTQGGAGSKVSADESAIRAIIANETKAWNAGDAEGYSRDFAQDGIFTNIRGQAFSGHEAFVKQHAFLFQGPFHGTTAHQDVSVLVFPEPATALVETLTAVSGLAQMPPGATPDARGRLRSRLLQVLVKRGGEWKIVAYHNVDVKPGTEVPEPLGD